MMVSLVYVDADSATVEISSRRSGEHGSGALVFAVLAVLSRQCLGQWLLFLWLTFFSSIAAWDGLFSLSSCLHDLCVCVCVAVSSSNCALGYIHHGGLSSRPIFLLHFRGRP